MRIIILAALSVLAVTAHAAPPSEIGKTTEARHATAQVEGTLRLLAVPDAVHLGETIETAENGGAKFILRDQTAFTVGPGTRLILDKFVYDPERGVGEIALRNTKGAIRFFSGGLKSDSYELRTPTASVGVRGTILELFVDELGRLLVVLIEGASRVCNAAGCTDLATPGDFVLVSGPDVAPSSPGNWRGSSYNSGLAGAFTWIKPNGTLTVPDPGAGPYDPRDIPGAIPPSVSPPPSAPAAPPPPPPEPGPGQN